jgi:glyoxylate/hydroxypyruvate reductase A
MSLLFVSAVENAADWIGPLTDAFPGEELRVWPAVGDPAEVRVAFVAKPPPGVLATLSNLELIVSMWVGVDGILADPTLPRRVPLTRMIDPVMTALMTESVCHHVLYLHRQIPAYQAQARSRVWRQLPQSPASATRVGILGHGTLGRDAAAKLRSLGFDVACWSRRPREEPGLFTGDAGFEPFLARTDILVCLLPATAETRGLICARNLTLLPRGASLVNVARGVIVNDADLLAALDSGHIAHAVLDVFHTEPLPAENPFWTHPAVTVLPHVAAISPPESCVVQAAETVRRFRAGLDLPNRVDPLAGY